MPADESAVLVVARFLKANGYTESYQAFTNEANLSPDAGDATPTGLTLEKLLEEKRLFDQSVSFEKLSVTETHELGWSPDGPRSALQIDSLPSSANLLSVVVVVNEDGEDVLLASTSDRRVNTIRLPSLELASSSAGLQDSPVLSQVVLENRYHVSASMSGSVVVASLESGKIINQRKDHAKYVVGLAYCDHAARPLLASAGWDNVVNIYAVAFDNGVLGEPLVRISLPTKPESLLFAVNPDTDEPMLVVTRTDSSYLHFYSTTENKLLGRQNLAPHSNAWVAFTPTSIALCPTDRTLLAVATNSVPHMKLIVVKLLFPYSSGPTIEPQTAREQAVLQQRVADREHNAIKLHCNTMSSQTPYSSPLVVWRPSGKGVWVNSDDGIIRGMDTLTGKVVEELRGHEAGTKVRTLWAGHVHEGQGEAERLISGGFDHKLIVWKP